jgi:hypothetical protein
MPDTFALSLFALPGQQALASPTSSGRLLQGTEKAAERCLLEVLTETGSLRFLHSRGTSFLALAGLNNALSELDVYAAFAAAIREALTNLQTEESEQDADHTRIAGGRLTQLTIGVELLAMTAQVFTRAGSSQTSTVTLTGNVPDDRASFSPD